MTENLCATISQLAYVNTFNLSLSCGNFVCRIFYPAIISNGSTTAATAATDDNYDYSAATTTFIVIINNNNIATINT